MLHFVGRWDVGWSRGGRKWSVNCKRGLLATFGTSNVPRWANFELSLVASPTRTNINGTLYQRLCCRNAELILCMAPTGG